MDELDHTVTRLLNEWSDGDQSALDQLIPIVHGKLRLLARRYMRRERSDHTLQPTALVNEAYFHLVEQKCVNWQNRAHFFAAAAQTMRRILIDYAKSQKRVKRGSGAKNLIFDDIIVYAPERSSQLLALDEALIQLAKFDRRKSQVVELRYFGGLSIEETAETLKISLNTVVRDWALAKAWLRRELETNCIYES
ncbi:MAG: sigma-70 family RNA polymerase sigma factor [Pyrinomonadaceae bacterium]